MVTWVTRVATAAATSTRLASSARSDGLIPVRGGRRRDCPTTLSAATMTPMAAPVMIAHSTELVRPSQVANSPTTAPTTPAPMRTQSSGSRSQSARSIGVERHHVWAAAVVINGPRARSPRQASVTTATSRAITSQARVDSSPIGPATGLARCRRRATAPLPP